MPLLLARNSCVTIRAKTRPILSPGNDTNRHGSLSPIYDNVTAMPKSPGRYIKSRRKGKGLSSRKLAQLLGVPVSVLSAIEKDRIAGDASLLKKIADLLHIPGHVFRALVGPTAREEASNRQESPTPPPSAKPSSAEIAHRSFSLEIYESELQAIGQESSSWDSETGGDLFGIWSDVPIIYLATKCGPKAVRDQAHFRLDVEYLIALSAALDRDWGLRYFGDWHSHHRLELRTPSSGDRARIVRLAAKNSFEAMAECIVTFSPSYETDKTICVHPYAYLELPSANIAECSLIVRPGVSPIREAMIEKGSFSDQRFHSFSDFPLERVVFPMKPDTMAVGSKPDRTQFSESALQNSVQTLQSLLGVRVELHNTAFGHVLVGAVSPDEHLAFAIDGSWPHTVLQVNRLNRTTGTSIEINVNVAGVSILNEEKFAVLIESARATNRTYEA
jgi:transcriptional regulator with XRE-family HTH domain